MPNLAIALKAEISRLARKEARSEIEPLRKAMLQQRGHIASLRREVEALQRAVKRTGSEARVSKGTRSKSGDDEQSLRFRAGGLASHRKRLGLSAADFGRLLGVSGQSIYKWEAGEVKPRRAQLQTIAAIRKIGKREALARLSTLA